MTRVEVFSEYKELKITCVFCGYHFTMKGKEVAKRAKVVTKKEMYIDEVSAWPDEGFKETIYRIREKEVVAIQCPVCGRWIPLPATKGDFGNWYIDDMSLEKWKKPRMLRTSKLLELVKRTNDVQRLREIVQRLERAKEHLTEEEASDVQSIIDEAESKILFIESLEALKNVIRKYRLFKVFERGCEIVLSSEDGKREISADAVDCYAEGIEDNDWKWCTALMRMKLEEVKELVEEVKKEVEQSKTVSEKVVRVKGPDLKWMWHPSELADNEALAIYFTGDVVVSRVRRGRKAWWWRDDFRPVDVPPSKWTVLRNFIFFLVEEAKKVDRHFHVLNTAVVVTETEILLCKWWEKIDEKGRVWRFFKPIARLEIDIDKVAEVEMRLQWWSKFGGKLVEDIVPRRLPRDPELRKERIEKAKKQLELFKRDASELVIFAMQRGREDLANEARKYLAKVEDLMKRLEELAKETERQEKTEEVEVQSETVDSEVKREGKETENKDWREEARRALKGERVSEVKRRKVLAVYDLVSDVLLNLAVIEKVEDHKDHVIVYLRRNSEKAVLKCRVREQLGFSSIPPAEELSLEELEAADSEDVADRGWIASERVIDECEVINTELSKAETVNIEVNVVERVQRVKRGRKVYEYRRMEVIIPKSEYPKLKEGKAILKQGDVEVEVRVIKSVKRWRGKEYERWAVLIPTSEQRKLRPGKGFLVLSS